MPTQQDHDGVADKIDQADLGQQGHFEIEPVIEHKEGQQDDAVCRKSSLGENARKRDQREQASLRAEARHCKGRQKIVALVFWLDRQFDDRAGEHQRPSAQHGKDRSDQILCHPRAHHLLPNAPRATCLAMVATPAWPRRSAPRLFVRDELCLDGMISVGAGQAHYLGKVMRVSEGDTVILCDNVTGEWAAAVKHVEKRRVGLKVVGHLRPREQVPDLWLCPALLKKDRFDWVLEKATELGARAIHPIVTRRCVADKLNLERARTVTTEAAEQCARTALPDLAAPQKLEAMLHAWPKDRALYFADEMGGEPAAETFAAHGGPAAILIGPEGGFDDKERESIRAHSQAQAITLGPRILRGETAAIAATALWMGSVGDWSSDRS